MIDIVIGLSIIMLAIIVISIIFIEDLFKLVMATGFISFICAWFYLLLDAVDVAITEAAVGAGVSTALFLITIHLTKSYDINSSTKKTTKYIMSISHKILFGILMLGLSYIFLESLAYMPVYGDINSPVNHALYKAYVQSSYEIYKVPNIVTMILGSFRGFDTLGETTVVFIAAIGVYGLLHKETLKQPVLDQKPKKEFVITSALFDLLPLLFLYAFYVQFHGDYGPGGGFQAGIILASIYILMNLVYGTNYSNIFLSSHAMLLILAGGVMIYAGVGFLTLFLGGSFLDYYMLGLKMDHSYHYGLFAIELGVGLTVFAAMAIIIKEFYRKLDQI